MATVPDLTAVKAYLGATSATDAQITSALAAETADQAAKCTLPEPYTDQLAEALMRRVAINLAARAVPIASMTTFDGGTTEQRVPWRDPVVVSYESPYRKVVVG